MPDAASCAWSTFADVVLIDWMLPGMDGPSLCKALRAAKPKIRAGWLPEAAETGLLKLLMNVFYPALVLKAVLGNPAVRDPATILSAPFVGFGTVAVGMAIGYYAGRALGLTAGHGLRTFAFAVGIGNYAYIALPIVESLWGRESLGVLLVHNIGCELAIWSLGILMLAGLSLREGWRKLVNPISCTLVVGLVLNALRVPVPTLVSGTLDALGSCLVPLGLLVCGATVENYFRDPQSLVHPRITLGACLLRLGLLPLVLLALAKWAPLPLELRRVIVVQAAMPAAMFPLVIARHYGGQPLVAAQIILATTILGILAIPLWIAFGLHWTGV